jgi:V/A-type H+-transporting ATPase subunit I
VIIAMSRVRVLGPWEQLHDVLREVQDLGLVHLVSPKTHELMRDVNLTPRQDRERERIIRLLEDLEVVASHLGLKAITARGAPVRATPSALAEWVRTASRLRRRLEGLTSEQRDLEEERALINRYREFFTAFESLIEASAGTGATRTYHVILRAGDEETVSALRRRMNELVQGEFELLTRRLASGETAVLLLVTAVAAPKVEGVLAKAGVHELPVPETYGAPTLAGALPAMRKRLDEIPQKLRAIEGERRSLLSSSRATVETAASAAHDRLLELEALTQVGATRHAFVLEGWMPRSTVGQLRNRLAQAFGEAIVVEEAQHEEWAGEPVPVVLSNPRLFRPFEAVTKMLPLPRYGSIDPTPFVAVFFPMFFGVMLGDVGYGLVLAAAALWIHKRSRPDTLLRSVSEIAGACATFSIIFGALYGELLGDLGHRLLGMEPLAFNREEAILPFLGLAVALGVVHVLLGLILGVVSAFRHDRRHSIGQGLAALMIVLVMVALLAAVEILPAAFFTPTVVLLLVAFPVLVVLEGLVAPVELLSTMGNMLSYARIMALGTASVMMAVVANQMVGALGSVVVGALFALLFHLVNFVIGVFSPTVHALRLHYVEFFGKFYSPGGTQYRPFGHWRATGNPRGRAAT